MNVAAAPTSGASVTHPKRSANDGWDTFLADSGPSGATEPEDYLSNVILADMRTAAMERSRARPAGCLFLDL
jgi:hypothetical protein